MNCKPGDLAIIINASTENVGAIVEVLNEGIHWDPYGGWLWLTRSERPLAIVWSDGSGGPGCRGHVGYVADANLRPITPPPGEVTESEVKKLYSGRELVNIVKERL